MMPSLSAMLGTTSNSAVLEQLNMASGGGVIFGQPGDPIQERYASLRNMLTENLQITNSIIDETRRMIVEPDRLVPITSEEAVTYIPNCMKVPFVMYAPIRTLLMDDRISGFGIDPRYLPDEDVHGRLANNGKADISAGDKEFVWTWRSDDPDLTDSDIEAIEATRKWVDRWLVQEMQPGGTYRDPTDPGNQISKKKKKEE